MSKVNLKILSERLNVSVSTVSKALSNSHEIGTVTKNRILETAERLGYRANPYAGFLRNHKSKTIALIIPELTNNFFIQAISGAETIAHEKDFHVLIYATNDDFKLEESILRDLQNGRVEGVIMSLAGSTVSYDHLKELIGSNIPVVMFDRTCDEIKTTKITTDDFNSGYNATSHLIERGCIDIAYLSVFQNLSIITKRLQGYLEALKKHQIPLRPERIIMCSNDEANNYAVIKQLLNCDDKPDGIFASVEKLALSSYIVCNDLNIKIPETVKVISFSNIAIASLLHPSLTTISQPAFEMGKKAASILFEQLRKKKTGMVDREIVMESEVFERDSTR